MAIKVFYALVSQSTDPALLPGLTKLMERYIAWIEYDRLLNEWVNRPDDLDPTVVSGSKGKGIVIQVVTDIVPEDKFIQILSSEKVQTVLTSVARKIVRMVPKKLINVLAKLGLEPLEKKIILGAIAFACAPVSTFSEAGIKSPMDFVKLYKLGWKNFVIVDESARQIYLCTYKTGTCFTIPFDALKKFNVLRVGPENLNPFRSFRQAKFSSVIADIL